MKYIMFEVDFAGCKKRVPIIFPDALVHALVAEAFQQVLAKHNWNGACLASAGECSVTVDNVGGESETLGIKSLELTDANIINGYDWLHGLI